VRLEQGERVTPMVIKTVKEQQTAKQLVTVSWCYLCINK